MPSANLIHAICFGTAAIGLRCCRCWHSVGRFIVYWRRVANGLSIAVAALIVAPIFLQPAAAAGSAVSMTKRIPVLCWHDIYDAADLARSWSIDSTTVALSDLIDQFELIRALGFTPISLAQWRAARAGMGELPDKPVLLTFDDGYQSLYTKVFPLLKAYRFPALAAVVSEWLDSDAQRFSNDISDAPLVNWLQLREMVDSGLVEVASHTHALHHGLPGNPQGNLQPAAVTRAYRAGQYESDAQYAKRLGDDLVASRHTITERLGETPQALVWPYGERNALTTRLAAHAGFSETFTLGQGSNASDVAPIDIKRNLMQGHHRATDFVRMLQSEPMDPVAALGTLRGLSLDLDEIYDPLVEQQESRLSTWIERIIATGVNTVFLRSWTDDNGDGEPDRYYFPNKRAPMRADLFNRVSWQLRHRAGVKVIAELKMVESDTKNSSSLTGLFDSLAKHANFAGIALTIDSRAEPGVAFRLANELLARMHRHRADLFSAISIDGAVLAKYTARVTTDTPALTDELVANLIVLRVSAPRVWTQLHARWLEELIESATAQPGLLNRTLFEVTAATGNAVANDRTVRADIASLDQLLNSQVRHLSLRQPSLLSDWDAAGALRTRLSATTQQDAHRVGR